MAKGLPGPVAFFPAAVSPPHLYAMAVMKLYLAEGAQADEGSFKGVVDQLKNWRQIPRETLMMVRDCCHYILQFLWRKTRNYHLLEHVLLYHTRKQCMFQAVDEMILPGQDR